MPDRDKLLRYALIVAGLACLALYPLSVVWPSGWAWHHGAPYESNYFMMFVGLYVTLGVCLLFASRDPRSHLSLIWFAIRSSVVHALIMAVQSFSAPEHMGHLVGDVPALLTVALVLFLLVRSPQKT
jgi:hypothetical protein